MVAVSDDPFHARGGCHVSSEEHCEARALRVWFADRGAVRRVFRRFLTARESGPAPLSRGGPASNACPGIDGISWKDRDV